MEKKVMGMRAKVKRALTSLLALIMVVTTVAANNVIVEAKPGSGGGPGGPEPQRKESAIECADTVEVGSYIDVNVTKGDGVP